MHRLFCWIPYSLRNYFKIFENFLNLIDRFDEFQLNYLSRFKFGAPELVLVISPSSELGIARHFFCWTSYS